MDARIVVGAASTKEGRLAVDWALRRAERAGLRVSAVYVSENWIAQSEESSHAVVLSDHAFSADAVAPHVEVATETLTGRAVDQLVDASLTARLVVVGAHSREDGTHEMRHSPALELAVRAHCPVVVVPRPHPGHTTGVVVGVDGSARTAAALRVAAADADLLSEELIVVNTWSPVNLWIPGVTPPQSYFDSVAAASRELVDRELIPIRAAHPELIVRIVVEQGFPAAVLARTARHASELVVGSRGLHGLAELMLGSVSHELLLAPPCPVVVVPTPTTPAV